MDSSGFVGISPGFALAKILRKAMPKVLDDIRKKIDRVSGVLFGFFHGFDTGNHFILVDNSAVCCLLTACPSVLSHCSYHMCANDIQMYRTLQPDATSNAIVDSNF